MTRVKCNVPKLNSYVRNDKPKTAINNEVILGQGHDCIYF